MENEIKWWNLPENKHLKKKLIDAGVDLDNVSINDPCPCIHLKYKDEIIDDIKKLNKKIRKK